jgi:hypothetical protein
MEAFLQFCEKNGLSPTSRHSRKAWEDSQKVGGGNKRGYSAKLQTLVAFGTQHAVAEGTEGPQGVTLILRAQGIETRDLPGAADVLEWQLRTNHKCDSVSFGIEYVRPTED